jgi:hypothetical protein
VKIEKCDGVTVYGIVAAKSRLDPGTVHHFMHPPFVQRVLMLLPTLCLVIEKLKNIKKIQINK